MDLILFVVDKAPEGGYNAKAIGQSIFTESETIEELQTNISDAIVCHFDTPDLPTFALKFVDSAT